MDERLDRISEQLARVLSILDAKEQKKQIDRDRIKSKREEDAAETAKKRGAIVVDRLTGKRDFGKVLHIHNGEL